MKAVCFARLVALSCTLGSATEPALGGDGSASPIQVVRTWQELQSQPPLPASPGTARLGLDTRQAPCGSGLLLYCLTEGCSLPSTWTKTERLGPFRVEVRHENDAPERVREVGKALSDPPDITRKTALFRRSIPLDRPGKYQVRLLTPGGDVVAETQVTATQERFHPWMPLEPVVADLLEQDGDQYDAAGHVRNRAKGIAIPRFDGMTPLVVRGGGPDAGPQRPAGERLPTLFPEGAEDGLTVTAKGTDLSIESKEDILLARPDWHFLARWWVNGKPFVPEQLDSFDDLNGMVILGKKLLLRLDFVPERIGAKPGDEVQLQLLYCKRGWELVTSNMLQKLSAPLEDDGPELLLSNRTRIAWDKGAGRQQGAAAEAGGAAGGGGPRFPLFRGLDFPCPQKGRVVDADTEEAIAGAVVSVKWRIYDYPMLDGAGSYPVSVEATTDDNGVFSLPRPKHRAGLFKTEPYPPYIRAPGYQDFTDSGSTYWKGGVLIYPMRSEERADINKQQKSRM